MERSFVEELSLNHWQSLSTLFYDGWVLRFADGYTKRANSVNPIFASTLDPAVKIDVCEKLYAGHRLRPTFKMTPFVQPAHLDRILENKGYAIVDPTSVRIKSLDRIRMPELRNVRIEERVNPQWLDHFRRLNHIDDIYAGTMERML